MKGWITSAWVALVLETFLFFAWMLYAFREMGRDQQERVMTIIYLVVPGLVLSIAALLLFFGQKNHSILISGLGCALVFLPLVTLAFIQGRRMLESLDNAHLRRAEALGIVQAQQFADPHLTLMAQAIGRNDTVTLQNLAAVKPADWLILNRDGDTLVAYAIKNAQAQNLSAGTVELVQILVVAGARFTTNTAGNNAGLMLNIVNDTRTNALSLLELALRAGGNPETQNEDGDALIHLPSCNRAKVEVLARYGANLSALTQRKDRAGWTGLMVAAHFNDWEKAAYLLEQGIPAKHRAPDGTTLASILERVAMMTKGAGKKLDPGYESLKERLQTASQ